jgi:hypothetical protein
MPVGVVKSPEDERHWNKAKTLAAKQGRAKDWAYIMGIYQKMNGKSMDAAEKCLAKSTTAALSPMFILTKWPGQVPTRENIDLLRQTKQMPAPMTVARMLNHDGAYLSPASVIDGLGLDRAKANEWRELLGKALNSRNELTVRHELVSKMLADRMAPELRRALFSRALSYYRDMRKSMVQIVTADELRKSTGEGSRGGNVIGHAAGGKPIYGDKGKVPWPDEQAAAQAKQKHFASQWVNPTGQVSTVSKAEQPGAIVDAGEQGDPDMRLERVIRVVCHRLGNAGPEGLSLDKLSDVIKTYGQPLVAKALNKACAQGGSMTFKKGLLQLRSV